MRLLLFTVLGLTIAALGLVIRNRRTVRSFRQPPPTPPDVALSFGYKCAWLAIRSLDPQAVLAQLPVRKSRVAGWPAGIDAAYGRDVFVSPPINGWVLVVGHAVNRFCEPDQIAAVSRALGTEVQLFATHRVSEAHAWLRAQDGKIVRAFGSGDGEVSFDVGAASPEEIALRTSADPDAPFPQESTVMEIAGIWSVDPQTLDERGSVGLGWIGSV